MTGYLLRRHRPDLLSTIAMLAAVAAVAIVTGRQMAAFVDASGLGTCLDDPAADCRGLVDAFGRRFESLQVLIIPMVLLPGLLGGFVAAPLVAREVEAGTHRFLWTQGVSRGRWLAGSLVTVGGLATLAGIALTVLTSAWLTDVERVTRSRFQPGRFDLMGVAPVGYCLFAAALGVAMGALTRRVMTAMAATVAVFAVTRLAVTLLVRPRLAPSTTAALSLRDDPPVGSWVLQSSTVDKTGRVFGDGWSLDASRLPCPQLRIPTGGLPEPAAVQSCIDEHGIHVLATYHPAAQFWTVRLLELAIYVGLTAGLAALAVDLVRRRIT